jgi:hypothetical protein
MINQVNERRRTIRLARPVSFEVRWRMFQRLTQTKIGAHNQMRAHGDSWGSEADASANLSDVEMLQRSTLLRPGQPFVDIAGTNGSDVVWALDLGESAVSFCEPMSCTRSRAPKSRDRQLSDAP